MREELEFTGNDAEIALQVLSNRLLETLKLVRMSKNSPDKQQRYIAVLEIKRK